MTKQTKGSNFDFRPMEENLPTYNASQGESSSNGRSDDIGDDGSYFDGGNSPRDRQTQTALQLQRACKMAIQRVKQNNILANSDWAAPLTAAPSAISVMAFLLKTAADKKAAGLTVVSTSITKDNGIDVIGTLPSKYFHTNLQHCSNLGRLAFLDAQKRMNKINGISQSMLQDGGSLSYIVDLLEDPEDAKDNLKPAIEEIKDTAKVCRENCEAIKDKFEYWYLVINHLSTTALDLKGQKVVESRKVEESINKAEGDKARFNIEANTAESEIQRISRQLDLAEERVSRAWDELDRLRRLPPIQEPSHYEDIHMASELVPMTDAQKIERGFFSKVSSSIFGERSSNRYQDESHQHEHRAKIQTQRDQIIAEEKARRKALLQRAEAVLREAYDTHAKLNAEIDKAHHDLLQSENRLGSAKANLAKASGDLKNLGAQELELSQIIEILRESTSELGDLKKKLEPLVLFFSDLENNISDKIMDQVDKFLQSIERNSKSGNDETATLNLGRATKKRVLDAAFQIQGGFSTITDISAAYVQISNNCIREAINRMEQLSTAKPEDWEVKRAEFEEWCQEAIQDIDRISREASLNMNKNMEKRVVELKTRAIEAAEDSNF